MVWISLLKLHLSLLPPLCTSQQTINAAGKATEIKGKGRHDPCVVPRAVVIVEAMTALVLADMLLRSKSNRII